MASGPILPAICSLKEEGEVVPIPKLPPGIKARLVVPPVWICLTPVEEERLITEEAPAMVTEVALGSERVALLIVAVPEEAPIFNVVAAPKALTVVAVVLKTEKEVEPVVTLVVNEGEVLKTKDPVPVSSDKESIKYWDVPEVVSCPPVVVKTPLEAVRPEKVIVPPAVKLFIPDKFPELKFQLPVKLPS